MRQLLRIRKLMYKLGILHPVRLPALVISVGNISLGGTGKSPLIASLAEWLARDLKKRVLLLSRGYGRKSKIPMYVAARSELPPPQVIGDEPWMIRNRVPEISVLIHRDRAHQAEEQWDTLGDPEVVLMDDAFQHWKAERDFDVVTVDATEGVDMGVIPFGRLREPADALARADVVVLTRVNEVTEAERKKVLGRVRDLTKAKEPALWKSDRAKSGEISILEAEYEFEGLFLRNELITKEALKLRPLVLLSGIAKPKSFRMLLEREGYEILHHIVLGDHAYPDERDLTNVRKILETENRALLVTTEKDWARLHPIFATQGLFPAFAKVRLRFHGDGEARLQRLIGDLL
jgi:tetraacyldisaccharide 4'-kinase